MISSEKEIKDKIIELIPLYVKGSLDAQQREEVECAAQKYPDIAAELKEWQSIAKMHRDMAECLPDPPPRIFPKILKRIEKRESRSFFAWLFPNPKFAWGVAALQFTVIIALGVTLKSHRAEFGTLSSKNTKVDAGVIGNVVFREETTEVEIRSLLMGVNAKIIDGPSPSRCYVILFNQANDSEQALNTLRGSSIVILAEKSY